MFSHLTRGYGTWQGIAKLEKPESALSAGIRSTNLVLPPINQERPNLFEQPIFGYPPYVPPDNVKLPKVSPRDADPITIPKTYTTKSGALLLYSEGCFVPGSRRLKKRPKLRKRKEKIRVNTMKDLAKLIMDYKKNECDPLLLEHLWRKATYSGRDLRPGFSPQRYLSTLLESTHLAEDTLRKLLETGSLRSFGTMEEEGLHLPLLVRDDQVKELLHQRPQPYTTMSLPPVSPSSSMLGSFTFYKHGMSTGAASMVSVGSMTGDSMDEYPSASTGGTYIDSLSERLGEVDSESGFKQSYESLSPKEKEDLLTQLLMDITLHNADEFAQEMPHNSPESSSIPATTFSSLGKSSKSSVASAKTTKSDESKSLDSLKSNSKSSIFSSVCSLPPIVPNGGVQDTEVMVDEDSRDISGEKEQLRSSSSGSGLGHTQDDLAVELDGINVEITDNCIGLEETEKDVLYRKESKETLFSGADKSSQYSLVEALEVEGGDDIHEGGDEVKSLKSLEGGDDELVVNITEEDQHAENVSDGSIGDSGGDDGQYGVVKGGDNMSGDSGGLKGDGDSGGCYGDMVAGGSQGGISGDVDSNVANSSDIVVRPSTGDNGNAVEDHTKDGEAGENHGGLQIPHISLSNLHDEVKSVAGEVLARPKSGRFLAEDAKAATALLMGRIERRLGPATTKNIRVSSATARKLRPLGQLRNSEVDKNSSTLNKNVRTKSAGPTLPSRGQPCATLSDKKLPDLTNETSLTKQDENENQEEQIKSVLTEEQLPEITESTKNVKENYQDEINLDDIIVSTDDVADSKTQDINEEKVTEVEYLTVKDIKTTERSDDEKEEMKNENIVKEEKKNTKKQGKGKKTTKKGNVIKGKGKKRPKPRVPVQPEPPKTPPFRAGLVPEEKPPKGLEVKHDEEKEEKTAEQSTEKINPVEAEKRTPTEAEKTAPIDKEIRVDSETGEIVPVDRETTPSETRKLSPGSHLMTSFENTPSLCGKTPSSRGSTPSSQSVSEKTSSEKTVSPTSSPRENTPSPGEGISPVAVEESGSSEQVQSPEVQVVVSEREKRANARAAQRAAAAERRRQEVERKRREREEARRKGQEEEARLEQLRLEAEQEMKKREEERRVQREREEKERCRVEAEDRERKQKERAILERQKRAREEWTNKKDQILAQRKLEEEMRLERERIDREMEEERQREYEAMIAHLAIEEQEKLLEARRLEEERVKREIEEERIRREEERQRILEERRRMEEELEAMRERQMARQLFLENLWKEYQDILFEQRTSRAFTFSYFDCLPWFKERWAGLVERPESSSLQSGGAQTEETIPEPTP